jgi:hypothetical protein
MTSPRYLIMLENFLADELTLAIAVSGEPNPVGGTKGLANGFELGGFVAALCWASVVKAVRPQKYWRPAFPSRNDILRLDQVERMALGREDISVARADGSADVFDLAGLLGDDDLRRHSGLPGGTPQRNIPLYPDKLSLSYSYADGGR